MDQARHKIVIVDDDHGVRTALERLLSASGYAVESFASGQELLRSHALSAAACLVIDVQLGAESGLDLACDPAVKRLGLPAVFITASDDPTVRAEGDACGAAAWLRKPFGAEELLAVLDGVLKKRPPA